MCVKEKGRGMNKEAMPYFISVSSYSKLPKQISCSLPAAASDGSTMCKSSLQTTSELCNGKTGTETGRFHFGA